MAWANHVRQTGTPIGLLLLCVCPCHARRIAPSTSSLPPCVIYFLSSEDGDELARKEKKAYFLRIDCLVYWLLAYYPSCAPISYRRQCQPLPCLVLYDVSGLGSALKGVISSLDISASRSILNEWWINSVNYIPPPFFRSSTSPDRFACNFQFR